MKIDELLNGIRKRDLVLPEFQREYVWTREQAKQLFVSLAKESCQRHARPRHAREHAGSLGEASKDCVAPFACLDCAEAFLFCLPEEQASEY